MTPATSTQGPGFLAALAAITKHEDYSVQIESDESKLRVTIGVEGHSPLVAFGPPAALDAQLPAAIAKYATYLDKQIADDNVVFESPPGLTVQSVRAVPTKKKAPPKKRLQRKAAAKKRPAARRKPAPKFLAPMYPDTVLATMVGADPITRVEVTKKIWSYIKRNGLQDKKNRRFINPDDKLKAVMGGKSKVSMFEMTKMLSRHLSTKRPTAKPAARRPAPAKRAAPASQHRAGLPGKAECIADYKALKAKHGDRLTRRIFVDNAKTGRRYEKLWANSWPAFVKEASGGKSEQASAPSATPTTAAKAGKAGDWPFPTGSRAAAGEPKKAAAKPATKPSKAAKDDKRPWSVKAGKKMLGATILEKKPGDSYSCIAGAFIVKSVDAEKREIQVEPAGKPPASTTVAPKSEASPPAAPAQKLVPYAIKSADGTTLGAVVQALAIGATWGPFDRWEVTAVDPLKREYTMKDRTPPTESTAGAGAGAAKIDTTEKTS